jgi:hypothetical protein
MKAVVLAMCVAILGSGSVLAQRTITNADLDKYRVQREAADRYYRENYEKMGFPSPEELKRQIEEDRIANERLIERWTQERIELQKAEAMRQQAAGATTVVTVPIPDYSGGNANQVIYDGPFSYGYGYPYYPNYGNRNYNYRRGYGQRSQSGYVSGGVYWPGAGPVGPRIWTPGTLPQR